MSTQQPLTYQQVVLFARQLPLAERVQLVRDILAEPTAPIEQKYDEESEDAEAPAPLDTLYGVFAGEGPVPSEEDIRAVRREVWR
jgi:hypothetical protein